MSHIINSSWNASMSQIVPKGLNLIVKQGDLVKTDQPLNLNPNVGGFGQEETEIVLTKSIKNNWLFSFLFLCFINTNIINFKEKTI